MTMRDSTGTVKFSKAFGAGTAEEEARGCDFSLDDRVVYVVGHGSSAAIMTAGG